MVTQLLAFVPVITVLCMVPGSNNLLVWRTAAEVGAGTAAGTAAGASAGIVVWSTGTAFGLAGLLAAVPGGLRTVALVGSLSMVGSGLWALAPRRTTAPPRRSRGFGTGLAVCLANPRTPLFAVSLLPQYAVAGAAATSTVALGVTWATVALVWNLLCVAALRRRRGGGRVVQRAGGVVVVGLGALGVAQAV